MSNVLASNPSTNVYVQLLAGNEKWAVNPTFNYASSTSPYSGRDVVADMNRYDLGAFAAIAPGSLFDTAIRDALETISSYTNLSLSIDASAQNPTFYIYGFDRIDKTDSTGTHVSAIAGATLYPNTDSPYNGFAVFGLNNRPEFFDVIYSTAGNGTGYVHTLALHELLHGLGLAHPFDTDEGTTSSAAGSVIDNSRYTVMSYTHDTQVAEVGHAATPMALDIAALHHFYGTKAKAGLGTEYILNDLSSSASHEDFDPDDGDNTVEIGESFYAIWDTGGTDTISVAGSDDSIINLNEAHLSRTGTDESRAISTFIQNSRLIHEIPTHVSDSLINPLHSAGGFISTTWNTSGERTGGFTIANSSGVTDAGIENARGGSGRDILIGNARDNDLRGQIGDDYLFGGSGDDTLIGGAGADRLDGGDGYDTASYAGSRAIRIDLGIATQQGGDAFGDTLTSVERVVGSGYGDQFVYSAASLFDLNAGVGADHIHVSASAYGALVDQRSRGEQGYLNVNGGADQDTLDLSSLDGSLVWDPAGNVYFTPMGTWSGWMFLSTSSFEHVVGATGGDSLMASGMLSMKGMGGDDQLYASEVTTLIDGGTGYDWVRYTGFTSGIELDLKAGTQTGPGGNASVVGVEGIFGTKHADRILGSDKSESLFGSDGSYTFSPGEQGDYLDGRGGDDALTGSWGNDTLIGGAGQGSSSGLGGSDTFVFDRATSYSFDPIYDYEAGVDKVYLGGDRADQIEVIASQDYWGRNQVDIHYNNYNGTVRLTGVSHFDIGDIILSY